MLVLDLFASSLLRIGVWANGCFAVLFVSCLRFLWFLCGDVCLVWLVVLVLPLLIVFGIVVCLLVFVLFWDWFALQSVNGGCCLLVACDFVVFWVNSVAYCSFFCFVLCFLGS